MSAWARLEKVDALSLSKSSANAPRGPADGGATTTNMMGTESREKEYYYVDPQKTTKGPLSAEELKMLLKAGSITIDTKLWSPGQKEYIPASAAVPGINTQQGGAVNTSSDTKKVSSRSPSETSATTPRSAASLKAVSDVVSSFDPIPVGRASKELKTGGSEADERRRGEEFEVAFATAYGSNGDTDKAVSTEGKSDKGGEERHDEISEMREKIKHLELELASVNAEAIHMKDMIDARDGSEHGLTEPEATTVRTLLELKCTIQNRRHFVKRNPHTIARQSIVLT